MWLHLPPSCLESPSAQASEALISEFSLRVPDIEASVTWRGKLVLQPVWSRLWRRGGFIRLLSGLTLPRSTADHGAARWISSLPEIPAKQTAMLESDREQMTTGFLSTRSSASLIRSGLFVSSERTSRGTSTGNLLHSSRHWKSWATALRQEYSVRNEPEILTGESGYSSWQTCRAHEAGEYTYDHGNHLKPCITLTGQAQNWETPSVAVTAGTRKTRGGERSDELLLTGQAESVSGKWTTPSCSDSDRGGHITEGMSGTSLAQQVKTVWKGDNPAQNWSTPVGSDCKKGSTKQAYSSGTIPLSAQAGTWPSPQAGTPNSLRGSAQPPEVRRAGGHQVNLQDVACHLPILGWDSPGQPIQNGQTSSENSPISPQPSPKRKLNPLFVEALMRWPSGLSGFDTAETELIRWLQPMRIFVWMLFKHLETPAAQGTLFDD